MWKMECTSRVKDNAECRVKNCFPLGLAWLVHELRLNLWYLLDRCGMVCHQVELEIIEF